MGKIIYCSLFATTLLALKHKTIEKVKGEVIPLWVRFGPKGG
jgi:hypothetical protein